MTITIRHAEPGDFEAVRKIYLGESAFSGTLQLPFPSLELWRKRLAGAQEGSYNLVACAGEEIVGQLGLHTFPDKPRRRHVGHVGIGVRDDWQGKGVGSALMQAMVALAENWLQLSRLELVVFVDNPAAIALYQKFGFVIEGTHRNHAFRGGEFVDTHTMARIRQ